MCLCVCVRALFVFTAFGGHLRKAMRIITLKHTPFRVCVKICMCAYTELCNIFCGFRFVYLFVFIQKAYLDSFKALLFRLFLLVLIIFRF